MVGWLYKVGRSASPNLVASDYASRRVNRVYPADGPLPETLTVPLLVKNTRIAIPALPLKHIVMTKLQPDYTKVHSMKIVAVNDLKKQINFAKKGLCHKYQLIFENGYEAEYCPPVGKFDQEQVVSGRELSFRIVHRGNYGDEIEPAFVNSPGSVAAPATRANLPTNVNVHPVTVALGMALRYHAEVRQNREATLDIIFSDADVIREYLERQINIENL